MGPPTWARRWPTHVGPAWAHPLGFPDAAGAGAGRILKSRSRPLPTHPGMKYFRKETLAVDGIYSGKMAKDWKSKMGKQICTILDQQRGFPLRKYFIPGCVGRGLDLDLRVCPAAQAPAPAASGNLGICPLGTEVEKQGFSNGLAHNRSEVSGCWAEIQGVHSNF